MDTHASSIIPIPLHALRPSPLNARTIDGKSLEELAASIAAEGLLQNLTVTEADDGTFEVVAGERRRGAMLLLRERGQLPAELESVPCLVVANGRAMSASLAENSVREKMHPADEFVAFSRLVNQGKSIEEIAAEFGIQPLHVQRHLRLANVAPSLFELFRQDKIKLDQMHALAVTDDHDAQEKAWSTPNAWERSASEIRARLTKSEIDICRDDIARFVGLEAIVAAGGIVRTDLFGSASGGLTDERKLIDQLALDKLHAHAESVKAEGWSWVDVALRVPSAKLHSAGRVYPAVGAKTLSDIEQSQLDEYEAEFVVLCDMGESDDEDVPGLTDEQNARYDELETLIQSLKDRQNAWTPKQLASAGAFITVGAGGALLISRGHLREGQSAPHSSTTQGAGKAEGGKAAKPDMSAAMVMRLTAQRTAILQSAIARKPELALVVLAHTLMLPVFYRGRSEETASKITQPRLLELEQLASELPLARYWNGFHDHMKSLSEDLPGAPDLFAWLLEQPAEKVRALIAVCVGLSIDTVVRYGEESKGTRRVVTDLTHAAGIDYADFWEPTRETFFNHVPRAIIEETVLEVHDKKAVATLATHKKDKLAEAGELLLAGKRWLPKQMRVTPAKATVAAAAPTNLDLDPAGLDAVKKAKPAPGVKAKPAAKKTPAAPAKAAKKTKVVAKVKTPAKKPSTKRPVKGSATKEKARGR